MDRFKTANLFHLDPALPPSAVALATELEIVPVRAIQAIAAPVWIVPSSFVDFDAIPPNWHVDIAILDHSWLEICKERASFVGEEEDWAGCRLIDTRGKDVFAGLKLYLDESPKMDEIKTKLSFYNATITPSLADCSHHIIDCDLFSPFATWLSRPDTHRYVTSLRLMPAVDGNVKLVDSAWIDHVIRTGKIDDERFAVDLDRVRRDGEEARLGAQEAQMKVDKATKADLEIAQQLERESRRSSREKEKESLLRTNGLHDKEGEEAESMTDITQAHGPWTEAEDRLLVCSLQLHPLSQSTTKAYEDFHEKHPSRTAGAAKKRYARQPDWFEEELRELGPANGTGETMWKAPKNAGRKSNGPSSTSGPSSRNPSFGGNKRWTDAERNDLVRTMARFSLKSAGAKAFVEASQRQSVHHERTFSAVWNQLSQGLVGGTQVYDDLILSAKSETLDFEKVVYQSHNSRKTRKEKAAAGNDHGSDLSSEDDDNSTQTDEEAELDLGKTRQIATRSSARDEEHAQPNETHASGPLQLNNALSSSNGILPASQPSPSSSLTALSSDGSPPPASVLDPPVDGRAEATIEGSIKPSTSVSRAGTRKESDCGQISFATSSSRPIMPDLSRLPSNTFSLGDVPAPQVDFSSSSFYSNCPPSVSSQSAAEEAKRKAAEMEEDVESQARKKARGSVDVFKQPPSITSSFQPSTSSSIASNLSVTLSTRPSSIAPAHFLPSTSAVPSSSASAIPLSPASASLSRDQPSSFLGIGCRPTHILSRSGPFCWFCGDGDHPTPFYERTFVGWFKKKGGPPEWLESTQKACEDCRAFLSSEIDGARARGVRDERKCMDKGTKALMLRGKMRRAERVVENAA